MNKLYMAVILGIVVLVFDAARQVVKRDAVRSAEAYQKDFENETDDQWEELRIRFGRRT